MPSEQTNRRIYGLLEARNLIHEAVELIKDSLYDTEHLKHAQAYIIPHLENWAEGNHNPYDYSILKYIEELEKEDNELRERIRDLDKL